MNVPIPDLRGTVIRDKIGVSDLLAFSLHRRFPRTATMRDLEGNTRMPVYLATQVIDPSGRVPQ